MIRRPPTSPLFPTTTLSRSWTGLATQQKVAPPANANCRDAFIAGKLGMWIAGSWNFTGLREAKVEFTVAPVPRLFKQPVVWSIDRKSTRLNSSHGYISYAVF